MERTDPTQGDYVPHDGWLVSRGRSDLVDLIADEYERRRPRRRPA
jgi:hypothetical protein